MLLAVAVGAVADGIAVTTATTPSMRNNVSFMIQVETEEAEVAVLRRWNLAKDGDS